MLLPLPTFICSCTDLQVLDLSFNNLSGSIHACLFDENFKNLTVLKLGRNNISGRIPHEISRNCSLITLDLGHNSLVGDLSISLDKCASLEVMNVGYNNIEGNFPCMLPSRLQVLVLCSNIFHGEITCRNKSWPNLQIIDIASNNFSGYLSPFNFSTWKGMISGSDNKLMRDTGSLGVITIYMPMVMDNTCTTFFPELNYYLMSKVMLNEGLFVFVEPSYYLDEVTLTIKGLEQKLVKIWPEFTSIDLSCNNFQGDIPEAIGELH